MEQFANALPFILGIKGEHRALAILRLLDREPSYRSNERIIGAWLEHLALGGPADEIRRQLEMLAQIGTVRLDNAEGLLVATLTELGSDAANGRQIIEGVLRPSPDERY
jgi:DNA-binding IclR family transcriptional regulator